MKVKVKLFATLRKYIKENDAGTCILELPENTEVQEVLDMLNIPSDIPKIILCARWNVLCCYKKTFARTALAAQSQRLSRMN